MPAEVMAVAGEYTLGATFDGNGHVNGWAFSGANPHGGTIAISLDVEGALTITTDDSGGTGWTGSLNTTWSFEDFQACYENDQLLTAYPMPTNTATMRDYNASLGPPGWVENLIGIRVRPWI
jgi:hypothetical protein